MLIAISLKQVLNNKTISRKPDGTFVALRSMFGIVPDDLDSSLAARENRASMQVASASADLGGFLDAQDATVRQFEHISIPVGTVIVPRAPETRGDTVYQAVHAGSLYAVVDDDAVVRYSSLAERKAAQAAALKVGA